MKQLGLLFGNTSHAAAATRIRSEFPLILPFDEFDEPSMRVVPKPQDLGERQAPIPLSSRRCSATSRPA